MTTRSTRYILTVASKAGAYHEETAYSRRTDALKRAKLIQETWANAETITVMDTYAEWRGKGAATLYHHEAGL